MEKKLLKVNKIIVSTENNQEDKKPINWLENKFIPIDEIFPKWFSARNLLEEYINKLGDWNIWCDDCTLNAGINIPIVKNAAIPYTELIPPEDRDLVIHIHLGILKDYSPDLTQFRFDKAYNITLDRVRSKIREREDRIVNLGGRRIKEEFYFRFGLIEGLFEKEI